MLTAPPACSSSCFRPKNELEVFGNRGYEEGAGALNIPPPLPASDTGSEDFGANKPEEDSCFVPNRLEGSCFVANRVEAFFPNIPGVEIAGDGF